MQASDDVGEPLADDTGGALVPMEDNVEYDEPQALQLLTFAVTYRQVRGALQASRMGS